MADCLSTADLLTAGKLTRREDGRLLTGAGRFTADLRFPDTAHAFILRSPHAAAKIRAIDIEQARAAPGVLGVFTAVDLASDGIPDLPCDVDMPRLDGSKAFQTSRPVLARDRVRQVGDPVALVIAESTAAATDAAELIEVDYEALAAVVSSPDALAPGAPAVWDEAADNIAYVWRKGEESDFEIVRRAASHVTQLDLSISRVTASPMEPRSVLGVAEDDGQLVLYISHQTPYQLRDQLAKLFGVSAGRLRVIAGDVGGSFGMKMGIHPEDVLILWAARRLRRPVRWISDRTEAFLADDHGRDIKVAGELALDAEGSFLALRVRFDVNIGCYLSNRSLASLKNIGGLSGVYRTPMIIAELRGVFTNTSPIAAYRGAGRPEATYVIERLIDVAARELDINPFELRRRNLIRSDAMPFQTGFIFEYDCGDFKANMEAAARLADLDGFPARRAAAARRGRLRGLGISNPIELAGGPLENPRHDTAMLRIEPDGSVTVNTGAMSTGQGLETTLTALVASRLGIPLEHVRYAQGDTDQLPSGRGSGGSSAICVSGSAVAVTVEKVIEKGRHVAAEALETATNDIVFEAGHFTVAGTDRSLSFAEVAALAEDPRRIPPGTVPGLTERGEFRPARVTFPNGCHICEVEIDPETGVVTLERYSIAEDIGRVLNPTLVHGQIHGGVAQGVGQALGEEIRYDSASGQLLSASFMDYAMPRASDVPEIRIETLEVPTAVNPLGAKGVGEAGTVGALAATMNAVCDALAPLDIRHIDMPATCKRVWEAIAARQTNAEEANR
jgi:carbon-monoxide dehydrogenase large subunit